MRRRAQFSYFNVAALGFVVVASVIAVSLLIASFAWEYEHDTPLLNYAGFLMSEYGMVPYRDFFETSMPGVFALHYILAKLGLTGNFAFLFVGNLLLVLVACIGAMILRPIGRLSALLFIPAYIAVSLMLGPNMIMQRDWLSIVPIAMALLLVAQGSPAHNGWRHVLIGVLCGMGALIKPQLAVGAAIIVLADVAMLVRWNAGLATFRTLVKAVLTSIIGFLIPILLAAFWLFQTGALDSFVALVTQYLPLHIQQTGKHVFLSSSDRADYLIDNAIRFGSFYNLVPFVAGIALLILVCWRTLERRQRIISISLIALSAAYSVIPVLAGQFWKYHYLPFLFFAFLAICSAPSLAIAASSNRFVRVVALMVVILPFAATTRDRLDFRWGHTALEGQVANIEGAIERHLPPDGRVQPIDWTSGVIHAMLRTKVRLATPFLYDYHFHHHSSSDVIAGLRSKFLHSLEADPPDLVVIALNRLRVSGEDVDLTFPEFEAYLARNFQLAEESDLLQVYIRQQSAQSSITSSN